MVESSEFTNRVEAFVGEWQRLTFTLNEGAAGRTAACDRLVEERADRFKATNTPSLPEDFILVISMWR